MYHSISDVFPVLNPHVVVLFPSITWAIFYFNARISNHRAYTHCIRGLILQADAYMSQRLAAACCRPCHSAAWSYSRELPTVGVLANLSLISQFTHRAFLCPILTGTLCAPVECSGVCSSLGPCQPLLLPSFHHTFRCLCPALFKCPCDNGHRGALELAHTGPMMRTDSVSEHCWCRSS